MRAALICGIIALAILWFFLVAKYSKGVGMSIRHGVKTVLFGEQMKKDDEKSEPPRPKDSFTSL